MIQRMSWAERFMQTGSVAGLWTDDATPATPPETCARPAPADDRPMARRLGLDEAVDLFLDHVKVERGLARHTLDAYGRDLARFTAFLAARGRADVDDIAPLDVTDFLLELAGGGLAARSRARTLVAVRGLCKHLVAEGWLDADRKSV